MQKDGQYLDVVDDGGNVLFQESRKKIHEQGLLHREIHVWIVDGDNKLVFQHRDKNKETFPDLLDASVGGHVESGDGWLDSAIKEVFEEAGLKIRPEELIYIKQTNTLSLDKVTGMKNNALRNVYLLKTSILAKDFSVEKNKAVGFESFEFGELYSLADSDKRRFIPSLLSDEYMDLYKLLESKIK